MKSLFWVLFLINFYLELHSSEIDRFIETLCIDSEFGYVLFGSKPSCFLGVQKQLKLEDHLSNDFEFISTLQIGAENWIQSGISQYHDDFILNVVEHEDRYEIYAINKENFLKTVNDQLSLFRFILGHQITADALFHQLAKGNQPFYKTLGNENVLAGIIFGFGAHNSLMGSRVEKIEDIYSYRFQPKAPFKLLKEELHDEDELRFFSIQHQFGSHSLQDKHSLNPSFGYKTLKEELLDLNLCGSFCSCSLQQISPRLIFGVYDEKEAVKLTASYQETQKYILSLFSKKSLVDEVFNRLKISKPLIKQPLEKKATSLEFAILLNQYLKDRNLVNFDLLIEGIRDSSEDKNPKFDQLLSEEDLLLHAAIDQFSKKNRAIEIHFDQLSKNPQFHQINENIFIKCIKEGKKNILSLNHSEAIFSYTVKSLSGETIFPISSAHKEACNLNDLIQGLVEGVLGMNEEEVREIHIHPSKAYGFYTPILVWEPLIIVIRLDEINLNSPSMQMPSEVKRSPIALLELYQQLGGEIIPTMFAYQTGYGFWKFINYLCPQVDQNEFIKDFESIRKDSTPTNLTSSISRLHLEAHRIRQEERLAQEIELIKYRKKATELVENKLYGQFEDRESSSKKLDLKLMTIDDEPIKEILNLEMEDLNLVCADLLKVIQTDQKGSLFIHPDLLYPSILRNPASHRLLKVTFEGSRDF